ncbi:H0502G05.11 protein, putative [Theobroma cacao]|uniref:H0502G05.11 protein, putative n=1 Tax=Theobroma cacao TaxID=3641 RepID=A0A061F9E7_THECC|nr:H0502G05.11 protein, putative [Theobroma cacao]
MEKMSLTWSTIMEMEKWRNGESTTDPLLNTTNPPIIGNPVLVTPSTSAQSFVTNEELEKLLDQKNKSHKFSEFNLILPYLAKFIETLGVASLDDDLNLKEFFESLIKKAYTWYVNLTPS